MTAKASSGAATVQGAASLALKAPQVDMKADAAATVGGAQVTVKGDAMAEFSSGGMTSVKGSLVSLG